MKESVLFYLVWAVCVQISISKSADVCETQSKKDVLQNLKPIFLELYDKMWNETNRHQIPQIVEKHCENIDNCCLEIVSEITCAFKCVSGILNKSQHEERAVHSSCDIGDVDTLALTLQITIRNELDFKELLRRGKEVFQYPQKIVFFRAMSTVTTKGDYLTVADMYVTVKNITVQEIENDMTSMETKLLNETLYTIAFGAWIGKIEGSYHPELFLDLLKGPTRNIAYIVVRDLYIYISDRTENGQIITNEFMEELINIIFSLLEFKDDIKEPITGILSNTIHMIYQSEEAESLDLEVRERLDAVYRNLNGLEKVLFASGEFCINMELFNDLQEQDLRMTPAAFIRNAGTASEPDYNWYLWANNPEGHLIRLTDSRIGVIAPNGEYDFEGTIYKNLNRYRGGFIKLRKDVCSDSFNVFVQYLCLPLYELMKVFKQSEAQPFDYIDRFIGEQSRNCVRLTLYKTNSEVVGNDI